jgi:hypothetical protein
MQVKKKDFIVACRFTKMNCVKQRSCKRRLETNGPYAALLPGPVTSCRSLQNAGKKEKISMRAVSLHDEPLFQQLFSKDILLATGVKENMENLSGRTFQIQIIWATWNILLHLYRIQINRIVKIY